MLFPRVQLEIDFSNVTMTAGGVSLISSDKALGPWKY